MSLFSQWQELAGNQQTERDSQKFWKEYFAKETQAYKKVLESYETPYTGKVSELASALGFDNTSFMGFLDGANASFLDGEKDLESLAEDSEITLAFDFEKLFFNMQEAKADWLFSLEAWDKVLSPEKRHEITKAFRASKVFVNTVHVGRNDPCPCGSGKKYKNCCGRNK